MSKEAENFSNNVRIIMEYIRKTQSEFSVAFSIPKTTINKWLIDTSTPKEATLNMLASKLNNYSAERMHKPLHVTPNELKGDSYAFASTIGVPLYKAHSVVAKSVVHSRNIEFKPNDKLLYGLTGAYKLFYPSVVYRGAFFAAAMRILSDDHDSLFYFEIMNNASSKNDEYKAWGIPSLYQFGSVGRIGKGKLANGILIGDLVGSEGEKAEGRKVEASVRFTSFKIPESSKPQYLIGTTIGLDFNKESEGYGHLTATPFIAIAVIDAPNDAPVSAFAPSQAYFNLIDMKKLFPDALRLIEGAPRAWCFDRIRLDCPPEAGDS